MTGDAVGWGCPDGLNEADYSGNSDWSPLQWRWEFVRRLSEYRMTYQLALLDHHKAKHGFVKMDEMWRKEYRTFVVYMPAGRLKYSLPGYPNPLYSDAVGTLLERQHGSVEAREVTHWDLTRIKRGDAEPFDVLGFGHAFISFDLWRPIAPQLEGLESYLEGRRHYLAPRRMQRVHPEKWIFYLRTLDAREAGHSWSVCAANIPPKTTNQSVENVRVYYQQGKLLQGTL